MRRLFLAIAAGAALFAVSVAPKAEAGPASSMTDLSAQRIEIGPGGVRVDDGRRGGPNCNELRAACERKDQLGERGEGNCRRYRELCAPRGPSRAEVCRDLRAACLNKERLGEQGEGNCRRYRQTCR